MLDAYIKCWIFVPCGTKLAQLFRKNHRNGGKQEKTTKIHELIIYFAKLLLSTLSDQLMTPTLLRFVELCHEKSRKTDNFYFIKLLLSRAWMAMINTCFGRWECMVCSWWTMSGENLTDDIYSFNKIHAPTGFDSTIQHLEKTSLQGTQGSTI